MNTLEGLDGLRRIPPGAAISIGNFDGVHLGHQAILRSARAISAARNTTFAVVTFEPHPLTVLNPAAAPPRLSPAPLKRELLADLGVEILVTLAPEPAVLELTAERFWQILRDEVKPAALVEGQSFSFGKGRGGNVKLLAEWIAGTGVELHVEPPVSVPLLDMQVAPISSSLIRWLLSHGRVRDAALCLGRPFTLVGEVVKGHQRGRTIGVPTANLACGDQLLPADAVYAGRCEIDGKTYPAAVSIGLLPTFGDSARQVEAHLIGFDGDLYGRIMRLELIDWIRDQYKFNGLPALKERIARDVASTISCAAEILSCRPVWHDGSD